MRITVCIKQVPGTTEVKIDPETGVLMRDGVDAKMNPYDLHALAWIALVPFFLLVRRGGFLRASLGPHCSMSVSLSAPASLMVTDASLPVFSSFAETETIPFWSMSNLTSICGTPRG